MRLADLVGWFGPTGLALCIVGTAVPLVADAAIVVAAVTTATFGVGHGALDHELPQRLRRAPRGTTARIAVAYAAVVGIGFVAFLAAPLPFFGLFLVVSALHFGAGDIAFAERYAGVRGGRLAWLRSVALGTFPIAIPVLAHPHAALASLPSLTAGVALPPDAWLAVRWTLLGAAALAIVIATFARARHRKAPLWYRCELPLAYVAFVVAPPAVAFFTYFGAWHAVRHLTRLAETYGVDPDGVPSRSARPLAAFALRALPMTVAAVTLVGVLGALLARATPLSLVALALGFAVTVPHTFAVRFFNGVVGELRTGEAGVRARVARPRTS